MKIQNKIIYILVSVFLVYTLIFSGFIYYSITNYAFTDFYKRLEIRAITTAKIQLENQDDVNVILELRQEYLEKLPDERDYIFEISKQGTLEQADQLEAFPRDFVQKIMEKGKATTNRQLLLRHQIHHT